MTAAYACPVRIAVLDDYQGVALTSADWSPVTAHPAGPCAVDVFRDHVSEPDALVARLEPYDAVVVMRERTPLPREVLARLPQLRLVVTTGRRNPSIDTAAAVEAGITVCGTESRATAPAELTWALILGLARRGGVDARVASPGRHDEPQPRHAREDRGRQRCPLTHDHDGVVGRQPVDEGRGLAEVVAEDVNRARGCPVVGDGRPVGAGQGHALVVVEHRDPHRPSLGASAG